MLRTMSRTSARSRRQRLRRLGGVARPVAASHPATITRTPATVTARWAVARPMLTTTTPQLMSATERRAYSSWCERDSWDLFTAVRVLTPEGRRRASQPPASGGPLASTTQLRSQRGSPPIYASPPGRLNGWKHPTGGRSAVRAPRLRRVGRLGRGADPGDALGVALDRGVAALAPALDPPLARVDRPLGAHDLALGR